MRPWDVSGASISLVYHYRKLRAVFIKFESEVTFFTYVVFLINLKLLEWLLYFVGEGHMHINKVVCNYQFALFVFV